MSLSSNIPATNIPSDTVLLDAWTSSKWMGLVITLADIVTVSMSVTVELVAGVVVGVTRVMEAGGVTVELVAGVVVGVTGVMEEAGVTVELVAGVVVGATGVMVIVKGASAAVELATVVAGVVVLLGGGANPFTCTAFGLISFANIIESVFCIFSSFIFVTSSLISLHTTS